MLAVGMANKLICKQLIAAKDFATIESETKVILNVIQTIKK
jgi:2-dehydro-3-deoxyphosphogluconate aldolase/(4S)-4-hydroxy-2-oxoglutarate aldolase